MDHRWKRSVAWGTEVLGEITEAVSVSPLKPVNSSSVCEVWWGIFDKSGNSNCNPNKPRIENDFKTSDSDSVWFEIDSISVECCDWENLNLTGSWSLAMYSPHALWCYFGTLKNVTLYNGVYQKKIIAWIGVTLNKDTSIKTQR